MSSISAVSALKRPLAGTNAREITSATLDQMVRIVRRYKSDLTTINTARQIITARVPQRSTRSYIEALQNWVRDHILYVPDPRDLEMVQTPPQTLSIGTGDCDDKSVLLATFYETIGLHTRFIAIAVNGGMFSHVLPQVRFNDKWLCAETIVPGVGVGWCPPDTTEVMKRHI